MKFEQRFKKIREKLDCTQAKFAELLGVKQRTISHWEAGRNEPSKNILELLSTKWSINTNWLLTGKGEMFIPNTSLKETASNYLEETTAKSDANDTLEIDKLSLKASAGAGIENFEVEVEEKLSISKTFFKTPQNPQNLKVIQIIGDSMEPTLQDGSYIVIDTSKKGGIDGIYALLLQDEVLVKRLQFNLDKTIDIISDNPTYKPQQYNSSDTQIPLKTLGMKILIIQ